MRQDEKAAAMREFVRQDKVSAARRGRARFPSGNLWVTESSPRHQSKNNMRWILRSKIHQANVTQADPNYIGSITIDEELMEKVGLWPGEKVLIVDNTNGERLETYVIVGQRNSGVIGMNGAAALKINVGDEIIIMGFELTDQPIEPKNILVDKQNKFAKYL